MTDFSMTRFLLLVALYTIICACCLLTTSSLQLPTNMKESIRLTGFIDQVINTVGISGRSKPYEKSMADTKLATKAFIIDQVKKPQNDQESQEISQLVISVFFEEEAELSKRERTLEWRDIVTPWKVLQIAYLRHLYDSDLRQKRFMQTNENCYSMFIAREVIADKNGDTSSTLDGVVYNRESLGSSPLNLTRGKIIGFVDITERPFGLIPEMNKLDPVLGDKAVIGKKSDISRPLRPILTNLSVKKEYRKSGVGSKLIECCENAVAHTWSRQYNEILLEVEQDNLSAQQFYEKRGYRALFTDPACRRLDTSGLILRQVRTSKICYRKNLDQWNTRDNVSSSDVRESGNRNVEKALRSLRSYMDSLSLLLRSSLLAEQFKK